MIDPRTSESAALADCHLRPRPGRDAFLALATARAIVESGRADLDFLTTRCDHWEAYRALLGRQSYRELAAACDVPCTAIEALADAYVAGKPTATLLGWGLHRFTLGHELIRAVDALGAVSGNIGLPGGGVSQGFEEWGPYDPALWGEDLHPPRRKFLMPQIGREILAAADPPVEVAVITAANPVCMAPNTDMVAQALDRVPFVVDMNLFLDDTADHADLFLPCAAFYEQRDIVASFGHNYVGPLTRPVAPPGQCRSQFDIFMDLARRFPFAGDFVKSEEAWLRLLLRPLLEQGVSWEALWRGPVRIPDAPMVPWADKVFATPTGRMQLLTEVASCADCRHDVRYPYHFLTVGGAAHLCSERVPGDHGGPVVVTMASEEAARLGIADGGPARLTSPLGSLDVTVRYAADARPDVVACERGGWCKAGQGVNRLIPDMSRPPGSGSPARTWTRVWLIISAWTGHGACSSPRCATLRRQPRPGCGPGISSSAWAGPISTIKTSSWGCCGPRPWANRWSFPYGEARSNCGFRPRPRPSRRPPPRPWPGTAGDLPSVPAGEWSSPRWSPGRRPPGSDCNRAMCWSRSAASASPMPRPSPRPSIATGCTGSSSS